MSQLKRVALMVFVTVESPEPDDPDLEHAAMKALRAQLGKHITWVAPTVQRSYAVQVAEVLPAWAGLIQLDAQPNAAVYEHAGIEGTVA